MYDACDDSEVMEPLGGAMSFRKRLDARRGNKPKKSNNQSLVCTPFDEKAFNFSKIGNKREILAELPEYQVLTNRFPLFAGHMLLVAKALVPQQLTTAHLAAVQGLLAACDGFTAYFNSWCASASVNHFHCHLIDEMPPVAQLALTPGPEVLGEPTLRPAGFGGQCYVFGAAQVQIVGRAVLAMQAANQPHNLLFTREHIYVFPKPLTRAARSAELYPETVGGPELIGSFTVYTPDDFAALSAAAVDELVAINTAPLPAHLLPAEASSSDSDSSDEATPPLKQARGSAADDSAIARRPAGLQLVRPCKSVDSLSFITPMMRAGHMIEPLAPPLPLGASKSLSLSGSLAGALEVGGGR